MATKPWDRDKYITPENEERVFALRDQMLAEVRAYRLREARQHQHLTQQQVADAMGVTKVRVSQLEHGQIDVSEVRTIASYVAALGGRLRLVADFGDEQIAIA